VAHHFESGFMVRKPSWHRLEKAVLRSSPTNWDDARKEAGLDWEVISEPVYDLSPMGYADPIEGWQKIVRNDKAGVSERVLSIQQSSYHVIKNEQFGSVINDVLGIAADEDPVVFEALMSLYGGRQIVAVCYFEEPLSLSWDPSKTYRYLVIISRHDGQGGLRILLTNVRVVCANTLNQAEMIDGRNSGFTIRHTANWKSRVEEVSRILTAARGESAKWLEFAEQLAAYKVTGRQRETFLKRFMPISDDMSTKQMVNTENDRDKIRLILSGDSCADIADTGYGLLMASTEWADHYRSYRSDDSYIGRQLLLKQAPKARAAAVLRSMAKVKD